MTPLAAPSVGGRTIGEEASAPTDPRGSGATVGGEDVGGYRLGAELGRGAMSVVYRAFRGGEMFALKRLTGVPVGEAVHVHLQFRREGAAIARLNHPSLVRVVEVGEDRGRPFLVMELVDGQSLEQRILERARTGEPLSDAEAVEVARAICGGLADVHRSGLVHRDIKPANIVISHSGAVKLIDFGLVTGATQDGAIVGTLQYASPEQLGIIKRPVGPPADLYSLGATLFEALTGRPPFPIDDYSSFFGVLATTPAPDLREVRPETGLALAAIVARLLAKDPDDRYQTARGLLADLDALPALEQAAHAGTLSLGAAERSSVDDKEIPLVGRDAELARLRQGYDRASGGATTVVQVGGESGSGKTRLLGALGSYAADQGAVVLYGRCQERETVPFGPLREATDRYAAQLLALPEEERAGPVERLRAAAGAYAPLVRRLSVDLARLIGDVEELRPLEPDSEQQRYYDAIAGFLRGLGSAAAPVVIAVDDLQWVDESSLRVLSRLTAGPSDCSVLLLTASRTGSAYREARAHATLALGAPPGGRVEVGALSLGAVTELVTARLGGRPVEGGLVRRLATLTNGNPFALGQYLYALLDGGLLQPVEGCWEVEPGALDTLVPTRDVVDLMVARVANLDPIGARVLAVASLVGARFDESVLAQALEFPLDVTRRCLAELVLANLLEQVGASRYVFVHDRVRSAASECLDPKARMDLHQALAEILEEADDGSAGHLYSLARHHGLGHTDRNPRRACERNLAAGLRALGEHANEEAFSLLQRARELSVLAGNFQEIALPLLEGLGRSGAFTGRLDEAFGCLEEALGYAHARADRFRIKYLLTLTYASQGRNDDALAALFEAFRAVGRPFPASPVVQALVLVQTWVWVFFLRTTGLGYGSAGAEERKQRTVLSQLHYSGSMIALFQGRPFLMLQFVVRDLLNVHYLGPSREAAIACSVYGAVMGMFTLRGAMERNTRLGSEMGRALGDSVAVAICGVYRACGTKWAGDLVRGNRMMVEALPELHREVPGSWYAAMSICEQAYSYLHGGLSAALIAHTGASAAQLERTNNLMFRYNTGTALYAQLAVVGRSAEANRMLATLEEQFQPMSGTVYVGLARCVATLEVLVDGEDTGPEVDVQIGAFRRLLSEDYYSNAARMLACYARMNQFLAASEAERPAARRRFEWELLNQGVRALVPVFRCHTFIFRAVLARADGRYARAKVLLGHAERLATFCESRRGQYYAALEQARVAGALGDSSRDYHAGRALAVATSESWRLKTKRVREEFNLVEVRPAAAASGRTMVQVGTALHHADQSRRYADALLAVSLASATTLDPYALAQNTLTEIARVLGAERALFFLLDPETQALRLQASAGTGVERISQTVVRRVLETRQPLVLTGTDDGESLGSLSIVAYGLRSIIAAPLLLRSRLIGVVYLDSRLAKAMFTEEDVSLLLGLANHVAIAVETARTARLEAERAAMARDLELLSAVQAFLLPKSASFEAPGLRGMGVYRPAAQCGGDWWAHRTEASGCTMLLLGDVSGHGAGPAMISSAIAGAFQTVCSLRPDASPREILDELHLRVRSFGGGFHMTMSLVRVDPFRAELTWWNAGGPEAWLQRPSGGVCLSAPGGVLGYEGPLELGERTVPFGLGDRLFVCTDGVLELQRADGRPIGMRTVSKLVARLAQGDLNVSCGSLGASFSEFLGSRRQEDDITFIVVEGMSLAESVAPANTRRSSEELAA